MCVGGSETWVRKWEVLFMCLHVCVGRGNASLTRHFVQPRCHYETWRLDTASICSPRCFCPSIFVLLSLFISSGISPLFSNWDPVSGSADPALSLPQRTVSLTPQVSINFTWAVSLWNIRQRGERLGVFAHILRMLVESVPLCQSVIVYLSALTEMRGNRLNLELSLFAFHPDIFAL